MTSFTWNIFERLNRSIDWLHSQSRRDHASSYCDLRPEITLGFGFMLSFKSRIAVTAANSRSLYAQIKSSGKANSLFKRIHSIISLDMHVKMMSDFLSFLILIPISSFFVPCSEKEAAVMRANSWLYQFYSLHSKMHFGLTYEATTRLSSFYSSPGSTGAAGTGGDRHHSYSTGPVTPGSPGTSPDSNHSLHSLHHHHHHPTMHPYHPHALHAGLGSLHGHPSSHYGHHTHLQYSPQAALPYPSLTGLSVTTSPASESESSHQTSLKAAHHPSFPFFPSSAAAFVCLCWSDLEFSSISITLFPTWRYKKCCDALWTIVSTWNRFLSSGQEIIIGVTVVFLRVQELSDFVLSSLWEGNVVQKIIVYWIISPTRLTRLSSTIVSAAASTMNMEEQNSFSTVSLVTIGVNYINTLHATWCLKKLNETKQLSILKSGILSSHCHYNCNIL